MLLKQWLKNVIGNILTGKRTVMAGKKLCKSCTLNRCPLSSMGFGPDVLYCRYTAPAKIFIPH